MSDRYERVYEVGLLDDLHNYFPALLYQQNNFQTVQDVLLYIRERTERRFNLFDYGRRQYESSMPIPLFPRNNYIPQSQDDVRVEFTNATAASAASAASLFPLFRSLGITSSRRTGLGLNAAAAAYQDVIVHASQTIIDAASTEETLSQDLESICTICQDRLRQGELTRKLTVCGHSFHKTCVDYWLLNRSVRCPTCRHDVRELTLRPSSMPPSPLLTAAPNPTSSIDTDTSGATGTGTATGAATGAATGTGATPTPSRLRQRDTNADLSSSEIMALLFGRTL